MENDVYKNIIHIHYRHADGCLQQTTATVGCSDDSTLSGAGRGCSGQSERPQDKGRKESEDWHTNYIACQRLAQALSQSNPEEALRLMKKALTVYEQHPDDERNYVMLLDYAGTYASQVAFAKEGSYDEALGFVNRAYDIAKKKQMKDMMCQTLTSLANIAWAKDDYRQAVSYARQAATVATPDLKSGTQQVLARSYLSLNMLDSAETVYRQINPGSDVHLAYIVQSNLAKIAIR